MYRAEIFISTTGRLLTGRTHNQINHILRDRRWHSSIFDVGLFRGANCDTDHYLLVAKIRERLAGSKREAQKFDVERFNFRTLNESEVRKNYKIKILRGMQLRRT
jgi:hypothetical protein